MGMSVHLSGIRPPDEKWKAMKRVWDACEAAMVLIPDAVLKFFHHEKPDSEGVVVPLSEPEHYVQHGADGRNHYDVQLDKLPKDVKVVRFTLSW